MKIEVGNEVAFNTLQDATWFDVLEINGSILTLQEHGTTYATQRMDKSLVKQVRPATIETGLTGPDWEPDDSNRYYAQRGKEFEFGPTVEAARAALTTHRFSSTGDAYDATQCDERIKNGDTLLIEREGVVGLAWTWPLAVTAAHGALHCPKGPDDTAHVLKDAGITEEQARAAVALAIEKGFPVSPQFAAYAPDLRREPFAEIDTIPAYFPIERDSNDHTVNHHQLKWGHETLPPPAIGDTIYVTVNSIGPAQVLGYFTQCGYLGVRAMPTSPPEWYVKQNGRDKPLGAFGAELEPLDDAWKALREMETAALADEMPVHGPGLDVQRVQGRLQYILSSAPVTAASVVTRRQALAFLRSK